MCPKGNGNFWCFFHFHCLNGIFLTEMYLTNARKVDNISVQTIYHWKRLFIGLAKK